MPHQHDTTSARQPPASSVARIGSPDEWRAARLALLGREKELTRLRDEVAAERRRLPWMRLDKQYDFDGPDGTVAMRDLFDSHSQLIVYHFMFGPGWAEGCPLCSFWADSFNAMPVHLAHRDAAFVAVSRAPFPQIDAYRRRMGWSFRWYSSAPGEFNYDFGVSATPEQRRQGGEYNFRHVAEPMEESPGLSVFATDDQGEIFHTYSTYSRGLDPINSGYQLLDLTPKGRDEKDLPWTMAWVRRHDAY
ncbi:MAG TPA: DUF899 domain-containing protein [Streptosporangiaceae bacterium]|nr:DUF899 domain-containing protein [Streptosporangiaceae bacterium]